MTDFFKSEKLIEDRWALPAANYLYGWKEEKLHISRFANARGEAGLYDSLSQCNRCGYCESVCPTYILSGEEELSSRGRNQLVKMAMEGKFTDKEKVSRSVFTCLLCGACASACYGKVPTHEHVLEGRRSVKNYSGNPLLNLSLKLMLSHPGLFSAVLKTAFLLKKAGLSKLLSCLGIFHLLGMPQMSEIESAAERVPLVFLKERLKKDPELKSGDKKRWIYFAPCGPNYIYPEVGLATVKTLKKYIGSGLHMNNFCCGLTAYNYGKLEDAAKFARKNIELFERLSAETGEIPLVCDCSSCAAFLKEYPRLFREPGWKKRAENFSKNVRDALEAVPPEKVRALGEEKAEVLSPVTYHDSCRACHGQGIREEPRLVLRKMLGKDFVEMKESDFCCGGAGAYFFTQKEMSEKILRRKILNIAGVQARTVVAGSTSCLMQLGKGLRKNYSSAGVVHYSVFLAKFGRINGKI